MDELNRTDSNTVQNGVSNEKIAEKYFFLREKIMFAFKRGKKILKISKVAAAVFFLLFTVVGIIISHKTGRELLWLQMWILLIFLNVTVFVIADYNKYLIEAKVIPYLSEDERIEFGEYDIFLDDEDDDEEDEED